jgi:phosphoribosylanthranilate isomerase
MSVLVKICGITNTADGQAAVEAGADALGFVFWEKSPRSLSVSSAAEIIRQLPPLVVKVGVFVDPPPELVLRAVGEAGINLLQFHGSETPGFCTQFGIMCIKAFRIRDENSLEDLKDYDTQAWLLDAYTASAPGGTGERFNWDLALRARQMGRPIFLAGGLTPGNVAEAVARVRPYGVDVSSGVEASPGRKDHTKVKEFVRAAKAAAAGNMDG